MAVSRTAALPPRRIRNGSPADAQARLPASASDGPSARQALGAPAPAQVRCSHPRSVLECRGRFQAVFRTGSVRRRRAPRSTSSKGLRHIRWTPCLLDVALQRHAPGIPRVPNALWVRRSEPVFLRAAAAPAAPWHSAHCKPWPAAYNCLIDTGDSQKTPNFFARFLTLCLNKLLLFLFSSGSCPCQRALRSGKLKLR